MLFVLLHQRKIRSAGNNRQTAKACRGRYLAFLDGDDFWHDPTKLQKQVDYLESHPECGLVYSSYDVYHPSLDKTIRDFIRYKGWEMPKSPTLLDFLDGNTEVGYGILTCTIMLRRDLYDEVKASDPYLHTSGHFLMGDTQLWAEVSTKTQLKYIDESLATHIISEESATRSKDQKKELRFTISGVEMALYLCKKYNAPSSIIAWNEDKWCNKALQLAFLTRDERLADEVRTRKKKFSWKEWLRYVGAHNLAVHYGYRTADFFRNLFIQKHDSSVWL